MMQNLTIEEPPDTLPIPVPNALVYKHGLGPWNKGDFRVLWDVKSSLMERFLIEACGKGPDATTASDMENRTDAMHVQYVQGRWIRRGDYDNDVESNILIQEFLQVQQTMARLAVPASLWRLAVTACSS